MSLGRLQENRSLMGAQLGASAVGDAMNRGSQMMQQKYQTDAMSNNSNMQSLLELQKERGNIQDRYTKNMQGYSQALQTAYKEGRNADAEALRQQMENLKGAMVNDISRIDKVENDVRNNIKGGQYQIVDTPEYDANGHIKRDANGKIQLRQVYQRTMGNGVYDTANNDVVKFMAGPNGENMDRTVEMLQGVHTPLNAGYNIVDAIQNKGVVTRLPNGESAVNVYKVPAQPIEYVEDRMAREDAELNGPRELIGKMNEASDNSQLQKDIANAKNILNPQGDNQQQSLVSRYSNYGIPQQSQPVYAPPLANAGQPVPQQIVRPPLIDNGQQQPVQNPQVHPAKTPINGAPIVPNGGPNGMTLLPAGYPVQSTQTSPMPNQNPRYTGTVVGNTPYLPPAVPMPITTLPMRPGMSSVTIPLNYQKP